MRKKTVNLTAGRFRRILSLKNHPQSLFEKRGKIKEYLIIEIPRNFESLFFY